LALSSAQLDKLRASSVMKGHFQKRCLSKAVASITEGTRQLEFQVEQEEPDFYLDTTYLDATTVNV